MNLKFDTRGNLFPYNLIECTFEDFQAYLVDSFVNSSTRKPIFDNLKTFLTDFKNSISEPINIWINGSFVTKKENPNDIDCVILINFEAYQALGRFLETYSLVNIYKEKHLDLYFLIQYPSFDKNAKITEIDRLYWINQFTKTPPNRANQQFSKGFLQIIL